jgi:maltooligosyltrehalose synthase
VGLKEVITIKEIRSHTDHKTFNKGYIKAIRDYIENVLLNTYDQQDEKTMALHEEVYSLNAASMLNIDRLITLCLQIARAPQAAY